MFNLVKVLELTLNDGVCLLTGKQLGLRTGTLASYESYEALEKAYEAQIHHFVDRMIPCCEVVETKHAQILPSPFLSTVIDDCIARGIDVTAGGATYNLSGIQAIQVANVADSLAVVKTLFDRESREGREELLEAMRTNYEGKDTLRNRLANKYPKYGNDVEWVDAIGDKWIAVFDDYLKQFTNVRGGIYHTGLYTVSAHVPMGQKVGATPDGRRAKEPLADGGMSAVYGRDTHGPTSLLKSVSRINSLRGSNGTLLNMKFLPQMFATEEGVEKFADLLRALVRLKIIHVQFNVLNKEDLLEAQKHPAQYRTLTVRVAGYTAYFTELASDLQDEIIARTTYGEE
jgi:formate C-acetyltransferase